MAQMNQKGELAFEMNDTAVLVSSTNKVNVGSDKRVQSMSNRCCSRIISIIKAITVEVALFLALFSEALRGVTQQTLLLDRVCRNQLHYKDKICDYILNETYKTELENVQESSLNWKLFNGLLLVIPTIIMSMIIGAWSDKHGRKAPLLMPLIGAALTHILLALFSYFEKAPVYLLTLALIPTSLFGIFIVILLSLSYVSDITSHHERTSRIAYLEGFSFIGYPLGTLIGGILYKEWGYIPVFVTGAGCDIVAVIYVCIRIKETRGDPTVLVSTKIKDIFNYKIFMESLRTFSRRREGTKRSYIILMLLALCCFILYYECDSNVGYFYSQLIFDWTNFDYSLYKALTAILGVGINLVLVPVLSLYAGVKDVSLGALGALSAFINCMVFGYAFSGTTYYLGKFLGLFAYNLPVVIRSFISKLVSEDELGKVFAFVSMVESLCPVLASLLYVNIYKATFTVFPSTTFFIGALFMVIATSCFLWIDLQERKRHRQPQLVVNNDQS